MLKWRTGIGKKIIGFISCSGTVVTQKYLCLSVWSTADMIISRIYIDVTILILLMAVLLYYQFQTWNLDATSKSHVHSVHEVYGNKKGRKTVT